MDLAIPRQLVRKLFSESGRKRLRRVQINSYVFFELMMKPFLRKFSSRIFLTYDSGKKQDGTGAQIQRLFGIFALSKEFGLGYISTPIQSVAIHPLDPFQSPIELENFLKTLNREFQLPSTLSDLTPDIHEIQLDLKSISSLFKMALLSLVLNRRYLIKITEPYSVIDHWPNSYRRATTSLENWDSNYRPLLKEETFLVVLHYRRGVGGMAIQQGERYPREIAISYYKNWLTQILKDAKAQSVIEIKVIILTDAPIQDTTYIPIAGQEKLWKGSPGFEGGTMSILGSDLEKEFSDIEIDLQIISGGSPIDAIKLMSQANALVMSRSSLSYIGALLNLRGEIIYPPGFWHPKLNGWIEGGTDASF